MSGAVEALLSLLAGGLPLGVGFAPAFLAVGIGLVTLVVLALSSSRDAETPGHRPLSLYMFTASLIAAFMALFSLVRVGGAVIWLALEDDVATDETAQQESGTETEVVSQEGEPEETPAPDFPFPSDLFGDQPGVPQEGPSFPDFQVPEFDFSGLTEGLTQGLTTLKRDAVENMAIKSGLTAVIAILFFFYLSGRIGRLRNEVGFSEGSGGQTYLSYLYMGSLFAFLVFLFAIFQTAFGALQLAAPGFTKLTAVTKEIERDNGLRLVLTQGIAATLAFLAWFFYGVRARARRRAAE